MSPILPLLIAMALVGSVFAHGDEDHSLDQKPGAVSPAPTFATAGTEAPQRLADGSVFVPKAVQRVFGIRTEAAPKGEFHGIVELPGRVIADPKAGGRIQATQAGTIAAGPGGIALVGQRVARGEVLAWLVPSLDAASRADRQAGQADLKAQAAMLEKRLARLIQLEDSVPKKDIEQARIELDSLHARRAATAGALEGRIALRAPVAGVVAASQVVVGQVVEAKDILFEIVDPRRLAVEALAFEALTASGLGRASARSGNAAAPVLALDFVGAGRSLREQALPVLFRVRPPADGTAPLLAVGQSLNVLAETGTKQAGVALPASALGRNGSNETVVWVHAAAERFVPHRVRTVPLDAERMLVLEGLAGGEHVVVRGAPALNQIR
jgi:cobalt-zinc-cadmium efflux system membrane fusion protein